MRLLQTKVKNEAAAAAAKRLVKKEATGDGDMEDVGIGCIGTPVRNRIGDRSHAKGGDTSVSLPGPEAKKLRTANRRTYITSVITADPEEMKEEQWQEVYNQVRAHDTTLLFANKHAKRLISVTRMKRDFIEHWRIGNSPRNGN